MLAAGADRRVVAYADGGRQLQQFDFNAEAADEREFTIACLDPSGSAAVFGSFDGASFFCSASLLHLRIKPRNARFFFFSLLTTICEQVLQVHFFFWIATVHVEHAAWRMGRRRPAARSKFVHADGARVEAGWLDDRGGEQPLFFLCVVCNRSFS